MGTPDFAVPCLKALINSEYEVSAVFTQPDKPKGRGYALCPPPVKECALENSIEVYQPKSLKTGEAFEKIREINPDVIVVVAYGKILPDNILEFPKYGCVNIHASLLPKYRGAAPIHWAVMNGETESGVTAMQMDSGLDTGDILLSSAVPVGENETTGELHDKLADMGAELIIKTLDGLENNAVTPQKQGETTTAYASMLDREICKIDWNQSALSVHNKIRGLSPFPAAVTTLNGKKVKLYQSALSDKSGSPGEIVSLSPLTVACKNGAVEILQLQLEGKKRMNSRDFLLGHKLKLKDTFGN